MCQDFFSVKFAAITLLLLFIDLVSGSNLAVMSSLFGGAHGTDARKALLIDFQQYWSAHAESKYFIFVVV